MRTVVMRPGSLVLEERPKPEPGPGQVLAKTVACGICGSDLHLFRHAQDFYDQGVALGIDKAVLDRGVVLGHEFIGEVVAFGPECREDTIVIGDRVCSVPFLKEGDQTTLMGANPYIDGAYAEYFVLAEELLIKIPDNLPTAAAALTEPLAIGLHAVEKAQVQTKNAAVVMGCGPIGLAVIAMLKAKGVTQIIAGDFSPKRRQLALAMGATVVVDAKSESLFSAIPAEIQTQPAAVFECTGVSGLIAQAVAEAPPKSQIVVAGIAHGEDSFVPALAIAKELSLHFVSFYRSEEFEKALDILAAGDINWQPLITGKVGLEGVAQAFEDLKDPEAHAKILIYPHGE